MELAGKAGPARPKRGGGDRSARADALSRSGLSSVRHSPPDFAIPTHTTHIVPGEPRPPAPPARLPCSPVSCTVCSPWPRRLLNPAGAPSRPSPSKQVSPPPPVTCSDSG